MEKQFIGVDLGRGYVKGYTEYNGIASDCLFQSIVGDGREIDYSKYSEPMHLAIDTEEFFVGELAEKESFNPINNYSDDKTTDVAEKLLYALLNKLAVAENVQLCIGVPNKSFNKTTAESISKKYQGKTITIEDKIKNITKKVNISKVGIFRESDAALFHAVNTHKDRIKLQSMRVGMVTVGFRTSELSYFDIGMKFNDKLSDTKEVGNRTVLDIIQKSLSNQGITKTLNEIDNDSNYNALKEIGYKNLLERINQEIEMTWINYRDMKIFIAGGTCEKFKNIPEKFEKVDMPQLITAKGLFFIAQNLK
ncbi:ParM/StbA family protein [Clostridium omnivorum]|uniref:Actin-like protein N-terminal domain-containing protein n=1 Tax=Clostridium omnivorum TaxID=1604902 RepID=A0ABQ5ND48_9CLOT|nr:ParM/StbA family protein [Clostridium sp. E14]GLC32875.1 hypothetical protein bsdE14_42850 [Clostridium sp. E14]